MQIFKVVCVGIRKGGAAQLAETPAEGYIYIFKTQCLYVCMYGILYTLLNGWSNYNQIWYTYYLLSEGKQWGEGG